MAALFLTPEISIDGDRACAAEFPNRPCVPRVCVAISPVSYQFWIRVDWRDSGGRSAFCRRDWKAGGSANLILAGKDVDEKQHGV